MTYSTSINNHEISLSQGDITTEKTDAIVNAANSILLGSGGVDGAIHQAAGAKLLEECKMIKDTILKSTKGLLPTGHAVITQGYNLKAKYVIHTVGPIYQNVDNPEELLKNAYFNSLQLAEENNIKSISFPSIGTGVYGCPVKWASRIALSTIIDFLEKAKKVETVRMVLFSKKDYDIYQYTLADLVK